MEVLRIIAYISFAILTIRWLTSLLNLVTGAPRSQPSPKQKGEISILVPARNEAHNLPRLLQSLLHCDNTVGEILIYNDLSEDETSSVVNLWSHYDSRIRLIEGSSLPEGWKGKNHACHQLALQAKGSYFLFLDADVVVTQEAIDQALSYLKRHQLALFSFFPRQEMRSLGEWLLVSQVNIILVSLLPLAVAQFIPFKILSAANGQFMLFEAERYRQQNFHKKQRHQAVEDIAIAQYIKQEGLTVRTALGPEGLKCRMYRNYQEALSGLSRSARFFFGGSIGVGWLYVVFSSLGWLPVLLTLSGIWLLTYFLLLVTMRIFVSAASGQSILKNLILMPLQQVTLVHLFINATRQVIQKRTTWKGRTI